MSGKKMNGKRGVGMRTNEWMRRWLRGAVAPVLDLGALLAARADGSLGARVVAPARRPAATRTAPLCLVVDDSVSVRRTTEIFVRDLGFEVDGASDGVEALERVRRRVPDLMLVDMEMPRMNGLELVRALRAEFREPLCSQATALLVR